ncbi:hypothetical protein A2U01_0030000, partial [Trifolium medium]|nr:hypothetical protein [Trifolium medium]
GVFRVWKTNGVGGMRQDMVPTRQNLRRRRVMVGATDSSFWQVDQSVVE